MKLLGEVERLRNQREEQRRRLEEKWQSVERDLRPLAGGKERARRWAEEREILAKKGGVFSSEKAEIDRVMALKDRFRGERIFILGNGPSLLQTDLSHLANEFTFGTDRVYLLADRLGWRPTFYTVSDWSVVADSADEINRLPHSTFFFEERFRGLLRSGWDVFWYWHGAAVRAEELEFALTMRDGIRAAGSATASAIQIAFHLGFDPIYLVGCDAAHPGADAFGSNGNRPGDPDVKRTIRGYEQCRVGIQKADREIFNATVGGTLKVFQRVEFESLFPKPRTETSPLTLAGALSPRVEVAREDQAALNEAELAFGAIAPKFPRGVYFDVGAHHGSTLGIPCERGWEVHAFEPDPTNRQFLTNRRRSHWLLHVDDRAVSDVSGNQVDLFGSNVSSGVSSLVPFMPDHASVATVSTVALRDYCKENRIEKIDLLKVDVEGWELKVLEGFPWDLHRPAAVVVEFEDSKTMLLGYNYRVLADFLLERGYTVFVSEWYPILRYGSRHSWRSIQKYPCELADSTGWGNLVAFLDPVNEAELQAAAQKIVFAAAQRQHRAEIKRLTQPKTVKELLGEIGKRLREVWRMRKA